MPRLMSVAFTEQAVLERRKTVTRRKGWWLDKNGRRLLQVGDRLTLCRKIMGRKPGEPLVRLCDVEVIEVSREPLWTVAQRAASEMYIEPMCGREVPKPDAVNRCACEPCGYLADVGRPGRCEREGYESGYCLACIHGCFE